MLLYNSSGVWIRLTKRIQERHNQFERRILSLTLFRLQLVRRTPQRRIRKFRASRFVHELANFARGNEGRAVLHELRHVGRRRGCRESNRCRTVRRVHENRTRHEDATFLPPSCDDMKWTRFFGLGVVAPVAFFVLLELVHDGGADANEAAVVATSRTVWALVGDTKKSKTRAKRLHIREQIAHLDGNGMDGGRCGGRHRHDLRRKMRRIHRNRNSLQNRRGDR